MAEKKISIVIKKIDGGAAGAHGGGWKVAFADFMTAMMCFFLVMWLCAQTAEVKSDVASYFTGPSMLEHDFSSYGAELTLEKLFLDLVNEPLKTAQNLLQPVDFTPNLMAMGSKKIVLNFVASELGNIASNVSVESDHMEFEIPEHYLFTTGTSNPSAQFVNIMTKIHTITAGIEDSRVDVDSVLYQESVYESSFEIAQRISESRKDLIGLKIKSSFEHDNNEIFGSAVVKPAGPTGHKTPEGFIKIRISQKEKQADGRKPRPLEDLFEKERKPDLDVYNDFVRRVSQDKNKSKSKNK